MIIDQPEINVECTSSPESRRTMECRAILEPDEDGGFCIRASRLKGVYSQGETREEAIENIREAFSGAIQSYEALNLPIPWEDASKADSGEELWILVHV